MKRLYTEFQSKNISLFFSSTYSLLSVYEWASNYVNEYLLGGITASLIPTDATVTLSMIPSWDADLEFRGMLAQHILILKTPLKIEIHGSVTIMCQLNGQFGENMKC